MSEKEEGKTFVDKLFDWAEDGIGKVEKYADRQERQGLWTCSEIIDADSGERYWSVTNDLRVEICVYGSESLASHIAAMMNKE